MSDGAKLGLWRLVPAIALLCSCSRGGSAGEEDASKEAEWAPASWSQLAAVTERMTLVEALAKLSLSPEDVRTAYIVPPLEKREAKPESWEQDVISWSVPSLLPLVDERVGRGCSVAFRLKGQAGDVWSPEYYSSSYHPGTEGDEYLAGLAGWEPGEGVTTVFYCERLYSELTEICWKFKVSAGSATAVAEELVSAMIERGFTPAYGRQAPGRWRLVYHRGRPSLQPRLSYGEGDPDASVHVDESSQTFRLSLLASD